MRILLAGGGTAGHINPAIAIANTVREHDKNAEIAFIGTKNGLENDLVPKAGYPIYHIEMSGLQRRFSFRNVKTAYLYFTAPLKAKKLIKKFRPDVVFGTGGYLSWPLLKAASDLGIPCAVHESNAIPGKAVKMLAGRVNKIYLAFPSTADFFSDKSKISVVGNPLIQSTVAERSEMLERKLGVPEGTEHTVLSFGGSLGSEKLNGAVLCVAKSFSDEGKNVFFVHSAGRKKIEDAQKEATRLGLDKAKNIMLAPYIYNMSEWEACADIVICRAGAMTLSELALYGKAAIIVPSPYVAENHQYENAKRLADAEAAILIEEKDLTKDSLSNAISQLISDPARRRKLCENIRKFAYPDAKERIFRDLSKLASEYRK